MSLPYRPHIQFRAFRKNGFDIVSSGNYIEDIEDVPPYIGPAETDYVWTQPNNLKITIASKLSHGDNAVVLPQAGMYRIDALVTLYNFSAGNQWAVHTLLKNDSPTHPDDNKSIHYHEFSADSFTASGTYPVPIHATFQVRGNDSYMLFRIIRTVGASISIDVAENPYTWFSVTYLGPP